MGTWCSARAIPLYWEKIVGLFFSELDNGMETHRCQENNSAAKLDATKFQEAHRN